MEATYTEEDVQKALNAIAEGVSLREAEED